MSPGAYVEQNPPEILRPFVVCTWMRDSAVGPASSTDRILPDGCVDIIWNGEALFVAGPDTGPVLFDRDAEPAGLASLAGYADQAHLSRECNALAGLTPLQLTRGSDVRLVQDGLTGLVQAPV